MKWTPKQWWAGQRAFVIGGGPSLEKFNWGLLCGELTVGCNDAYQLGPSVCSVCVFGDMGWFNFHHEKLRKFPNPVVTNEPSLCKQGPPWLLTMERSRDEVCRHKLAWHRNTGVTAVHVALALGATEIYLIGFDMKIEGNRANWHRQNIHKPNEASYSRFREGFSEFASQASEVYRKRKIYDAGPVHGLKDIFGTVELHEVFPGHFDADNEPDRMLSR